MKGKYIKHKNIEAINSDGNTSLGTLCVCTHRHRVRWRVYVVTGVSFVYVYGLARSCLILKPDRGPDHCLLAADSRLVSSLGSRILEGGKLD